MVQDELAQRYRTLIANAVPAEEFVQLRYRLTAADDFDLAGAALRLLLILTRRTLEPVAYEADVSTRDRKVLGAVVPQSPLRGKTGTVKIALPLHLCSEREGLTQIVLNATAGAEYNYTSELWLEDIELPSSVLAWFDGPRQGVDGIRRALRVHGRPIVGLIIKSRYGTRLDDVTRAAQEALEGGVDLLVDDLLLTDPDGELAFERRVPAVCALIKAFNARQVDAGGSRVGYLVNIAAGPMQAQRNLRLAIDEGAFGCLVDGFTMGFGAVKDIADIAADMGSRFVVVATNMGSGMMGRNPDDEAEAGVRDNLARVVRTGISEALTAKLSRVAGADAVHTGTAGSECWYPAEFNVAPRTLSDTLGSLRRSMPVAEGDLGITKIGDNVHFLGTDVIIETATGIMNHPNGVRAGARAYRAVAGSLDPDMTQEETELLLAALGQVMPEVENVLSHLSWKPATVSGARLSHAKAHMLSAGYVSPDLSEILTNIKQWNPRRVR